MRSSVAQAFDYLGQGLVLRGDPFEWDEEKLGRTPHLTREAARKLIRDTLNEYVRVNGSPPTRVVIHKKSEYWGADHGIRVSPVEDARGTEIRHLENALLRDQHVRRPEIAMEDLGFVGMFDALEDLHRHLDGFELVEDLLAVEKSFETLPLHVLHDDEERSVDLLRGQNGDDVRVIEGGEETRLLQEIIFLAGLPMRHLDRDLLVDPGVAGEKDRSESSRTEVLENLIFPDILAQQKHARG